MRKGRKSHTADAPLSAKITLTTTKNIKSLLERAAETTGLSLNAYILELAEDRAQNVLAQRSLLKLNDVSWARFKRAIDNPAPASDSLKKLLNSDDY